MSLNDNFKIKYNSKGRVLAFDVGKKNIGIAISDFNNKFCSEMFQIECKYSSLNQLFLKIAEKLDNWEFVIIIIGFPYCLNAQQKESMIQKYILNFQDKLQKWINNPDLKIIFEDERLTTKQSRNEIDNIKKWKSKKDALAAKIILETYLNKKIF